MPTEFQILVFVLLIVIILALIFKDHLRGKRLDESALAVLSDANRSKPTLDQLELVAGLVPRDFAIGVLQFFDSLITLIPPGAAENVLIEGRKLFDQVTDNLPNLDGTPSSKPQLLKIDGNIRKITLVDEPSPNG